MNTTCLFPVLGVALLAAWPGSAAVRGRSAAPAAVPDTTVFSAAHGYVETRAGQPGAWGIRLPEEERTDGHGLANRRLTHWRDGNAMAVYYIHVPADSVSTALQLTARAGRDVRLRLSVWDPQDRSVPLVSTDLTLTGTGQAQTLPAGTFRAPRADYFRYQLECLEGWADIESVDRIAVSSPTAGQTWKAAYLSSPSVHLTNWRSTAAGVPDTARYDWCYEEVMMPPEGDIPGTYVMSLGVLSGYMGIQNNGEADGQSRHEVLFSMWDDGSTEEDPSLPAWRRASVVDHDPQATVNRFGGEGTGMQTYYRGHRWEAGQWVQFLTHCRPETRRYTTEEGGRTVEHEQHNMLVSAWFNAGDGKGWQYMSTLRLPNNSRYFTSWYSFLENYNYPTGQARRKAYYRNGYARTLTDGRWLHFNQVGFGHTDGGDAPGARNDWGQGVAPEQPGAFFMATGGYLPTDLRGDAVPLRTDNTPVDTIDLRALEARVDQAVRAEQERLEADAAFRRRQYDKTGWRVTAVSSEETRGEGSNGRAALLLDGDAHTYWCPAWTDGPVRPPHSFTLDMGQRRRVRTVQLTTEGGRRVRSFRLSGSNDGQTWQPLLEADGAPGDDVARYVLPRKARVRYLRWELTGDADGGYARVAEVDVSPR